jgi:S-adenosylmethionine hydrolase
MTIITLTTDFGLADGYVGVMKGVIAARAPGARLIDLSHAIAPQDVRGAAALLHRAIPYFPAGTIHLAVIDPGVGSTRHPIIVTTPDAIFVGPDNGLFSAALAQGGAQTWRLDRPQFWLPQVSATFHGRDIFAPVAAHLANGVPAAELGSPLPHPVRLPPPPEPELKPDGRLSGRITHADHFGNLISDIPAAWVADGRWACRIGGEQIVGLSRSYADAPPGQLLMLISSDGFLEIAVRDGSARTRADLDVGAALELIPLR